ncbi:acyl-CoA desaturase [Vannielia litorea]|uniref:acyl-CoA desaturase n=1 Tax=Vannielia litorea TaxID=1217970 RepID=UPI001BD04FC0|nr:fatty acid desaturase [Vannielia litorea]MBS8227077.1 acyl-CoA desaturase [Vannielia litorea]
MELVDSERVKAGPGCDAMAGRITFEPLKAAWWAGHGLGGLTAVLVFPSWSGLAVFILLTGLTICAGHSVGMHRLLIHRAFTTPLWLERLLVWLGTLVGMAGPMGMIRAHDMRDWHQRQERCPPHPSHGAGFFKDAYWQLMCSYRLTQPPRLEIEPEVARDPVYRFTEATWMAQQLPLALALWALGGWGWVLWGICLRVWVSLTMHWMVGHYCHRSGHQGWRIAGLPVQGYNLPGWSLVTFGENWHGNHHAFPHSARLGVERGQLDPGFWFIRTLEALGLATHVRLPTNEAPREGLTRLGQPAE